MKKNIVHIGFPRSASTFIQDSFFPKVKKMDYLGKPHSKEIHLAMRNLNYLDNESYLESKASEVLKSAVKEKPIIISNEGISHAELGTSITQDPYVIAKRLREIFGDATIIIIIREQLNWFESYYLRRTKSYLMGGLFQSPNEFFFNHYHSPGNGVLGRIDYLKIYKSFKKVFSDVEIIPYEELKFDRELFIEKLINIVGEKISIDDFKPINVKTTKLRILFGYMNRLIIPGILTFPFKFAPKKIKKKWINFLEKGPKAKINFSNKIKNIMAEIFSESNKKLNEIKNLNLDKYDYFL